MTPAISRSRPFARVLACAVIGTLALAGCAGSGSDGGGSQRPEGKSGNKGKAGQQPVAAPEPKQPVQQAAQGLEAAVAARDCDRVSQLSYSGPEELDEQRCDRLLRRLDGFKVERVDEYGTGGAADFSTRTAPGTMVFVLGRNGTFKWAVPLSRRRGDEIVGTRAPSGNRLNDTATSTVEAFRGGQCERLAEAARGVLPQPKIPQTACENRQVLRKALERDADVRPRRLGANSRVAFYSLLPEPGGPYVTLVLFQNNTRSAFFRDYASPPKRGQ